jgi:hypothetical protein
VTHDQRDMRERLDVLHERRSSPRPGQRLEVPRPELLSPPALILAALHGRVDAVWLMRRQA